MGCAGGQQKSGPLSASPLDFLSLCAAKANFRHLSDQVEGKTPKALALETACVRL
jgi:hypothetical protein